MPTIDNNKELIRAIEMSRECPLSAGAFSVGALIFNSEGVEVGCGFSRETGLAVHAEEVALDRAIAQGANLSNGTLVSSLEPCGKRLSGRESCADKIIKSGIRSVVYAMKEPSVFVERTGDTKLRKAGISITAVESLSPLVKDVIGNIL